MTPLIRKAAVLGAGTMGSRIAAHLANAGLPVVLLDIPQEGAARSGIAAQALEALKKSKPAAFYEPALAGRIAVGNFEDHLSLLQDCDWVIEAVTENLAIKQALLARVAPHLKSDAILTTNTSGLPVASIAAEMPDDLRRRWFGTHFFNPPRYMRLVEIIATPETDRSALDGVARFADLRLGKEVVFARDTPNFIANRIGVFVMLEALRLMQAEDLTVEEVDALTGTAIGWPRAGTFRLADLVGLDVLAHVAANFPRSQPAEGSMALPDFVKTMLERRWLGDKTRQGFYKKEKDAAGNEVRLALDWKTLEYRPATRPKFPSLEMARNAERLRDRLVQLLRGDTRKDKAARFHWRLLSALWNYAADCLPEIADDAGSVDRAMCAGFNWEMGPFQLWDAAGVRPTVERMKAAGEPVSAVAEQMLEAGENLVRRLRRRYLQPRQSHVPGHPRSRRHRAHRPLPRVPRRGAAEPRRLPHRYRRWCRLRGTALRQDGHRRGRGAHGHRDAPPRWRCREKLLRLRGERRYRQFFRRRQPHATAAGHPGGRMGRRGPDDPRLPAHDRLYQVLPAPGRRGALRILLRRRRRDRPARRPAAGSRGTLYGTGRDRRRTAARRRRLQGDDSQSGRLRCLRRPARAFPLHRHGQSLHLRRRGPHAWAIFRRPTASP